MNNLQKSLKELQSEIENKDIETDLSIDSDALDVEWLEHAKVYVEYSNLASQAKQIRDRAKDNLEVVRSQTANEIRTNPQEYTGSDKKPAETAITDLVLLQEEYQEARKLFNETSYLYDSLMNIVTSLDARKYALQDLVKLHLNNYFAGPVEPRDLTGEYKRKQAERKSHKKEARQKGRNSLSRKKPKRNKDEGED